VDTAAFVDGKADWSEAPYFLIAHAFRQASIDHSVPIIWGGCWDRQLAVLHADMKIEHEDYCARWHVSHPGPGHPLVDLVHFELRLDPGLRTA
jgi:hypothetical protein